MGAENESVVKTSEEQIRELLEIGPLYRKLTFNGGKAFIMPTQIRLYCPNCCGERNWQAPTASPGAVVTKAPPPPSPVGRYSPPPPDREAGHRHNLYMCRDCGECAVTYFYYFTWKRDSESTIMKVGQNPPLESHLDRDLQKNMTKEDAELYRKALTSRNFNFGVGALAYLRRIVENKMNDLLDLIEEAAQQEGDVPEELKTITDVKKSWRFDDKITYAANALPSHLKRRTEKNPLDFLHDLSSEGLHHKSEDECIQIFDRCKSAFEYVFRQLRVEIDDAKAYIATLKPKPDKTS